MPAALRLIAPPARPQALLWLQRPCEGRQGVAFSRTQQIPRGPVCTCAALDGPCRSETRPGRCGRHLNRAPTGRGRCPHADPPSEMQLAGNQLSQTQAPRFCPRRMPSAFLQLRTPWEGLKTPLQGDLARVGAFDSPPVCPPISAWGALQGLFAWMGEAWRPVPQFGGGRLMRKVLRPRTGTELQTPSQPGPPPPVHPRRGPEEPALKPRAPQVAANGDRVTCSC